jgi:formiminotetrahydrofolate cyclodeaminase
MVAGMSRGKKAYQQYERELSDAIARLNHLREELKASVDLDAASYAEVMKAYKDAKTASAKVGERMISDALKNATRVPLGIAQKAQEVRQIVESLKPITSKNMWSDLAVASALARTAIEGGLANVQINLQELKDEAFKAEMQTAFAGIISGQESSGTQESSPAIDGAK